MVLDLVHSVFRTHFTGAVVYCPDTILVHQEGQPWRL